MTVLVTGAAGTIGTMLRQRLPGMGWSLRGFDRHALPDGDPLPMVIGDLSDAAALDRACAGVAAVVHLAGRPTEAPWETIRSANVDGAYELFEAARRARVPRVVFASSNHAAGFTERPPSGLLAADTPPRPDTLYGVSKVFGETLGRYYVDRYGMRVACLRIGHCDWRPQPDAVAHAAWLSPDDAARLVDACLRAPDLGYAIVWGVSANTGRWWSLDEAAALGYRPQDDAGPAAPPQLREPEHDRVGRVFTTARYGIDEIRSGG